MECKQQRLEFTVLEIHFDTIALFKLTMADNAYTFLRFQTSWNWKKMKGKKFVCEKRDKSKLVSCQAFHAYFTIFACFAP